VLRPGAAPITHRLRSGAVHVVVGRNGSGKTLLTRVLAGLARPAAGRVRLDDVDITDQSPGGRSVALVYQAFVNYPHWTVAQNISSPLLAAGLDKAAARDRAEQIADTLALSEQLDSLPHALSGGQQQRVAIGRALAKEARVLVMDEPLVNLDYKLREALAQELKNLLHRAGVCVVYTSSDPRDGFALGDEVLLLARHSIVQTGTPLEVYRAPASPTALELMSEPGGNRLLVDGRLRMVRPEHLHLERASDAGRELEFPARVLTRETNGSETFLHCDVAGNHWVARLDGFADVAPGAEVVLYASADAVYEFEAPCG